jgi:hypothetical protein
MKKTLIELPARVEFGEGGEHTIVFSNESKSKPFRTIAEAALIMADASKRKILCGPEVSLILKALMEHAVPPLEVRADNAPILLIVRMAREAEAPEASPKESERKPAPRPGFNTANN